jgi:hypothetical protein
MHRNYELDDRDGRSKARLKPSKDIEAKALKGGIFSGCQTCFALRALRLHRGMVFSGSNPWVLVEVDVLVVWHRQDTGVDLPRWILRG